MKKWQTILILIFLLAPAIINAAWWKPLSWFDGWSFFSFSDPQTEVLEERVQELEKKLEEKNGTTTESDTRSLDASEENTNQEGDTSETVSGVSSVTQPNQTSNQPSQAPLPTQTDLNPSTSNTAEINQYSLSDKDKEKIATKARVKYLRDKLEDTWREIYEGEKEVEKEMDNYPKIDFPGTRLIGSGSLTTSDCHDGLKLKEECRPMLDEYRVERKEHKEKLLEPYNELREKVKPLEQELKEFGYDPSVNWYRGDLTFKDPRLEYGI